MTYQYRLPSQSRGRPRVKYADLPVFKYQTYDPNSLSFVDHPVIPADRIIFSDRRPGGRSMTNSPAPSVTPSIDLPAESSSTGPTPTLEEGPAASGLWLRI